jgi:GntR family transcriptional regulator
MRFSIAPSDSTPIYRQIVDQVRREMAGGQLHAGHTLPSVRALAEEHTINPMTVSKAYSLLEAEGLLERHRGVGMVVAAVQSAASTKQRLALLQPALQAAAQQAAQLRLPADDALALFQRCLAQHPFDGDIDDKR